jgi:hypothetical protein
MTPNLGPQTTSEVFHAATERHTRLLKSQFHVLVADLQSSVLLVDSTRGRRAISASAATGLFGCTARHQRTWISVQFWRGRWRTRTVPSYDASNHHEATRLPGPSSPMPGLRGRRESLGPVWQYFEWGSGNRQLKWVELEKDRLNNANTEVSEKSEPTRSEFPELLRGIRDTDNEQSCSDRGGNASGFCVSTLGKLNRQSGPIIEMKHHDAWC